MVLGGIAFVVIGGLVYYYISKSETEDEVFDKAGLIEEHERDHAPEVVKRKNKKKKNEIDEEEVVKSHKPEEKEEVKKSRQHSTKLKK